jgi:hypothetical protein
MDTTVIEMMIGRSTMLFGKPMIENEMVQHPIALCIMLKVFCTSADVGP